MQMNTIASICTKILVAQQTSSYLAQVGVRELLDPGRGREWLLIEMLKSVCHRCMGSENRSYRLKEQARKRIYAQNHILH